MKEMARLVSPTKIYNFGEADGLLNFLGNDFALNLIDK